MTSRCLPGVSLPALVSLFIVAATLAAPQHARSQTAGGGAQTAASPSQKVGEGAWVNYDFKPGDRPLFVEFDKKASQDVRFRHYEGKGNAGVFGDSHQARGMTPEPLDGGLYRGRIMADGAYVKVYINDTRVGNIPNAAIGRSKTITFEVPGHDSEPVFLTNISIMAGGKKLYDALSESGRVATQGIYFDSGSDEIRPESTPTLKEIATMLKEHADLKLTIEGHTDNVGDAQQNLDLSNRRSAAVKALLVNTYGIDGERLESTGLGDTKPVAANTMPEGRQQNRRVELVKR